MTERKQLELAAKACGIDGEFELDPSFKQERWRFNVPYERHGMLSAYEWNPATNQLDSDRMGAKLRMNLWWNTQGVAAILSSDRRTFYEYFADHNNDENAALMAARLRCAVAIGEAME